jgi:glutamate racemase
VLDVARAAGQSPDTLVLGCTHYPLLRAVFKRAVPEGMRIIDSAEATAEAALRLVADQVSGQVSGQVAKPFEELRAGSLAPGPDIRCFATDSVEKFERLGSRFLGLPVGKVELVDLGG